MGTFHNLIFTSVDFNAKNEAFANAQIFMFSEDIYYSWTLGKGDPKLIVENAKKAYEAIDKGTFLIKRGDESKLAQAFLRDAKPRVKRIKLNLKKAFELEANHKLSVNNSSSLYYYFLPMHCYCNEKGIITNNDGQPIIDTYEKRQTIGFIHSKDVFHLKLPFYGPNEEQFNKLKDKHPGRIILPEGIKVAYRELKPFAADVIAGLIRG